MTSKHLNTSTEVPQKDAADRKARGEFVRGVSGFRATLGDADFPAAPGRYHLFVSLNCPWCHRVMLARNMLGLQDSISVDVAFPSRTNVDDPVTANLWEFNPGRLASLTGAVLPECTAETASGSNYRLVKQIYTSEGSDEGKVILTGLGTMLYHWGLCSLCVIRKLMSIRSWQALLKPFRVSTINSRVL